jgi:hypothetical protein
MSITNINISDSNVEDILSNAETDGGSSRSESADGGAGSVTSELLSKFLDGAFEDGKLDKNELAGLKALTKLASGNQESTGKTEDSSTDESDSTSSEGPTPQEFMSKLNDIASESKNKANGFKPGSGEDNMYEQAKRLMNATPEQRQAFLDKASELMDGGKINKQEDAELKGFTDGLLNDSSNSTEEGSETEKPFMDQVEDLLAQSQGGDEGPGEKMAREAAKLLEDNPEEDQQAFLDELDKLLNNVDGNGDYAKDIDEKNDGEGTMLKKMAEAFEELPADRGDSSSGSDAKSGSNSAVSAFLKDITSDGDISDSEISALRALVKATETEEAEMAG